MSTHHVNERLWVRVPHDVFVRTPVLQCLHSRVPYKRLSGKCRPISPLIYNVYTKKTTFGNITTAARELAGNLMLLFKSSDIYLSRSHLKRDLAWEWMFKSRLLLLISKSRRSSFFAWDDISQEISFGSLSQRSHLKLHLSKEISLAIIN